MAAKSTTVISLPQMVDLALNSPEVGVVNFTVLHSLLHVIVNQLDLGNCNVEFRGSDSERIQSYISTAKPGPVITLTEYTVGPDGKGRRKRRGSKRKDSKSVSDEQVKKDENQKEKEITIIKKDETLLEEDSSGSFQTIVVVEPASKDKIPEAPKFTIALTKEQLGKIQADIKNLQQQVKELTELPANIGLIEALKSNQVDKTSPVLDMFQILNLVKRVDAMEMAMNKTASMIEHLARQHAGAQHTRDDLTVQTIFEHSTREQAGTQSDTHAKDNIPIQTIFSTPEMPNKEQPSAEQSKNVAKSPESIRPLVSSNVESDISKQLLTLESRVEHLEKTVKTLKESSTTQRRVTLTEVEDADTKTQNKQKDSEANQKTDLINKKTLQRSSSKEHTNDLERLNLNQALEALQQEIDYLKESCVDRDTITFVVQEINELKEVLLSQKGLETVPQEVQIGQIELKLNELTEQVDTLKRQQPVSVQNLLMADVETQISELKEKINLESPVKDYEQNVADLNEKLLQLQDNMAEVSDTAQKLLAERENRQNTLDVMVEQIELLKTVKADKEDLEDALADKADACQINRKVSHEQFDSAWDELSRALEENMEKLQRQEEIWLQSLDEVQKEIGNKLDKIDLVPLKDFIDAKLKTIQDRVKRISSLKQEHEAAGTKSKYLRNVNCISCDADVVMRRRTDVTLFPRPYSMPASKNVGPYLAYELDQLRKQQKTLPTGKNVNVFENALSSDRNKPSDGGHLCSRYCGGSHTITSPEQRVMRVGHFMEQWGPEIAPIKDVMIRGTDGHLYRGRDDSALRALAAEKGPAPKVRESLDVVVEKYSPSKEKIVEPGKRLSGRLDKARPKTSAS